MNCFPLLLEMEAKLCLHSLKAAAHEACFNNYFLLAPTKKHPRTKAET